jgi:hypothetical protein
MKSFFLFVFFLFVVGCQKPYEIADLPSASNLSRSGDTTYIQKAVWGGFNKPEGILYGRDQLFYVMDTQNNRIVMLNQAGGELSELNNILHPLAATQDTRLDLIVGAETVDPVSHDTIGVVLRVKVEPASGYLNLAEIDTIWKEPGHPQRRFVGIGIIPGDEYLVVRDGPDNSSPVDPDSRVLLFRYTTAKKDSFITPLGDLQSGVGNSITSINHPTGIVTFPGKSDFVLTQKSDGVQYSAVWMVYSKTTDFEGWQARFDPSIVGQNVDFVKPNRFRDAEGVAIDPYRSDIFIVDAQQDSIVKFNNKGVFQNESFGALSSQSGLNHPRSVAIAQGDVYVCDTDNDRIVIYRLSTGN